MPRRSLECKRWWCRRRCCSWCFSRIAFSGASVFLAYLFYRTHNPNASSPTSLQTEVSTDCVEVPNTCTRAIDLTCHTRMNPEAFYHRIIDCLLPEYGVILEEYAQKFAGSTCLFGLGTRGLFYEALGIISNDAGADIHSDVLHERPPCGTAHTSLATIFGERYLLKDLLRNATSLYLLKQNAINLLNDVHIAFPIPVDETNADFVVLVVVRTGSRSFSTESQGNLLQALKSMSNTTVLLFKGDEDTRNSIEFFARADAVVMYHGAAAANLVFCKMFTVVIEITTYTDTLAKESWRRNTDQIAVIRPDLKVRVIHIPLDQVLSNDIIDGNYSGRDKDLLVKDSRNIQLLRSDAEGIKEVILSFRHEFSDP